MSQQSLNTQPLLRSISDTADEIGVPQHVLRFWETKFGVITPIKRAGGRRYYRQEDISLLHTIRDLLYEKGYTVKGVQKILQEKKRPTVLKLHPNTDRSKQLDLLDNSSIDAPDTLISPICPPVSLPSSANEEDRNLIHQNLLGLIDDLQQLKQLITLTIRH